MVIRRYTDSKGRTRRLCEFQQSGARVLRRFPHETTQAQAIAWESKRRSEIFNQVDLGRAPELTLEACVDLWLRDRMQGKKDQRMPRQNAEHLRPFLRGRNVSEAGEVARDAVASWSRGASGNTRASDRSGVLQPATINRRLAVLKAAIRYAYNQGWASENVSGRIGRLREPQGREVYLSPGQIRTLASKMPCSQSRAAVMLLAYTGLRAGELIAITSVDINKDSLTVRVSKTGRARTVPLPSPALPYVSALPLALSYRQLHWQFAIGRKAAGLPHVRIHDLRHSAASMLINAGVDLYTVGKILGHLTPSTTARYAHLADATLRKAMRRLK